VSVHDVQMDLAPNMKHRRFGHYIPQCRWLGGRRSEFAQRGERAAG